MKSNILKSKAKLVSFLLSAVLFCQGCSQGNENLADASIASGDDKSTEEEYLEDEGIDVDKYIKYFEDFEATYNLEENYFNEEEVKAIIERLTDDESCQKNYNYDESNISELIEKIRENSIKYLDDNSEYISAFLDYYGSDYDLNIKQSYLELMLKEAFLEMLENGTNDLNEDFCRIQDLAIVYINDPDEGYLGMYDDVKNLIIINIAKLEESAKESGNEFYDELYYTLVHELGHARQLKCDCRVDSSEEVKHLRYDGEFIPTYVESSVESVIYNQNMDKYRYTLNDINYTYLQEREDEGLLFLLALFNDKVTIDDYYNAMFDTNLEGLFSFFGCQTEEDRYDLFKWIYAIDAVSSRSSLLFGNCSDEELEDMTIKDAEGKIGYAHRSEIFARCLMNLAIYTNANNDFSLRDNVFLFNFIKAKITSDISCTTLMNAETQEQIDSKNNFIAEIVKLDDMYVKFLAEYYGSSIEEIRNVEYFYVLECWLNMYTVVVEGDYEYSDDLNSVFYLLERFPKLEPIILNSVFPDFLAFQGLLEENQEVVDATREQIKILEEMEGLYENGSKQRRRVPRN